MKNQNTFYSWMKTQSSKTPSAKIDNKILAYSAHHLAQSKPAKFQFGFKRMAALATIVVVVVLINKQTAFQKTNLTLMDNDSPEMILNYKDIELMADASDLSEAEWARINKR